MKKGPTVNSGPFEGQTREAGLVAFTTFCVASHVNICDHDDLVTLFQLRNGTRFNRLAGNTDECNCDFVQAGSVAIGLNCSTTIGRNETEIHSQIFQRRRVSHGCLNATVVVSGGNCIRVSERWKDHDCSKNCKYAVNHERVLSDVM